MISVDPTKAAAIDRARTIPEAVAPAQARVALRRADLLDAVTAKANEIGGEVLDWFEYALSWRRENQHINTLGAALGLTAEQIDALFITAAGIEE